MGKSINGLAVARFSVNVNVTVYITVNVAAPQHANANPFMNFCDL